MGSDSYFSLAASGRCLSSERSGRIRSGGSYHRGQAVRLKEKVEHETGVTFWVQAVVAVWGEFPQGVVEREKVVYLDASRLCEWLQSGQSRLSAADLDLMTGLMKRF
jgi:hypothetical protein